MKNLSCKFHNIFISFQQTIKRTVEQSFLLAIPSTSLLLHPLYSTTPITHYLNLIHTSNSVYYEHSSYWFGFTNILEGCRHSKVKHLLFASSSSVYSANTKVLFSVSDRTDCPVSLYAATKKANELMAYSYSHLYDIPMTGLRFFTVYGAWGRPDMAYFKFTQAIAQGKPIDIYNYGKLIGISNTTIILLP